MTTEELGTSEAHDDIAEARDLLDALPTEIAVSIHSACAHPNEAEEIIDDIKAHSRYVARRALRTITWLRDERDALRQDLVTQVRRANDLMAEGLGRRLTAITTGFNPHGWYVYVLRDGTCEPLYVGMSSNVLARLGQHLSNRSRRAAIASIALLPAKDARDASRIEWALIGRLSPPWNVRGVRS